MASVPKLASPAPSIFTSDPLEQIYARGTLDPHMAGLAGLMLYNAKGDREDMQNQYMNSLASNNKMEAGLQQILGQQDVRKELIKSGTELAGKYYNPGDLAAGGDIFSNVAGGDAVAKLHQDLVAAQAADARAKAATAGAGSVPGAKDQVVGSDLGFRDATTGQPMPGPTIFTGKGGTPEQLYARLQAFREEAAKRGIKYTPEQERRAMQFVQENMQHPGIADQ